MCEVGVTNAEPSEDNSISAVKVSEVAIKTRWPSLGRVFAVSNSNSSVFNVPLKVPRE